MVMDFGLLTLRVAFSLSGRRVSLFLMVRLIIASINLASGPPAIENQSTIRSSIEIRLDIITPLKQSYQPCQQAKNRADA